MLKIDEYENNPFMLLLLLFRDVLGAVLRLAALPPGGPAPGRADEAERVPVFGPLGAARLHHLLPARVTVTHPGLGQLNVLTPEYNKMINITPYTPYDICIIYLAASNYPFRYNKNDKTDSTFSTLNVVKLNQGKGRA